MTAGIQTDADFAFAGLDTPEAPSAEAAQAIVAQTPNPLGALAALAGTWVGHGFNSIWRPHHPASQDRFLELNMTDETLIVHPDQRPDPQPRARDARHRHVRPHLHAADQRGEHRRRAAHRARDLGERPAHHRSQRARRRWCGWRRSRTAPSSSPRASPRSTPGGPQNIPDNNILPFFFGSPAPANSDFNSVAQTFTELESVASRPRSASSRPGSPRPSSRTPTACCRPRSQSSLHGTSMKSRTFLHVATQRTASSRPAAAPPTRRSWRPAATRPAATPRPRRWSATFWIETIAGTGGQPDKHQLQYTQTVMLDFNGIHWPHVTVGTLVKQ